MEKFYTLDNQILFMHGKCNLNCKYCHEKNRNQHYNKEELLETIKEILQVQNKVITLTGGEPTIHSDFFEILQECLNKFDEVVLLSNLLIFSNSVEFYNLMRMKNLNHLTIIGSLDSIKEDIHDYLVGKKCFKEKIQALDYIYKIKHKLNSFKIGVAVSRYNLYDLYDVSDFIVDRWGVEILFKVININTFSEDEILELMPAYCNIRVVLNMVLERNNNFKVVNLPLCFMLGYEHLSLEYKVLELIYNGNNVDKELKIFRDEYPLNVFIEVCEKCVHREYCLGINNKYIQHNWKNEFKEIIGNSLFKKGK